jgi:hypothetical protein
VGFFFAADRAALMTSSSHDANVLSDGKITAPPDPAAGAATGSVAWVTSGLLIADDCSTPIVSEYLPVGTPPGRRSRFRPAGERGSAAR